MALALAGVTASAPRAAAQQCLTTPVALPLLSGPPVWFDPAPSTVPWRAELHDPRWAGAPLFNLCANANLDLCGLGTVQAQFRALIDGTNLYVAFHNLVDNDQSSDDAVFIGIGSNGVAGARMAKITLDTSASTITPPAVSDTTPPAPNGGFSVAWAESSNASNATNWTSLTLGFPPAVAPATTSWLQQVASWRGSPGVSWGITFRIDLTQFGYTTPITANIPIFFGSRHTPSVGMAVPLPNVTTDTVAGGETIVPGNKATWTNYTPPAAPGGCPAGVTIAPVNVGVVDGSSLIGTVGICPGSTGCPRTHSFRAQPQNVPDGQVVRTKMRLANFGSLITDWQNAPWEVIPGSGDPLVDSTPAAGWTFDAASGGVATSTFTCSLDGADYCPVLSNAPAQPDQCMLVELGNPPATNTLRFQNKAVYRNLWFTTLSSVTKTATINIKGLQQTEGVAMDRDVYLYVQTTNMPEHSDTPMVLPQRAMTVVQRYAERRPPPPPLQDPKGPKFTKVEGEKGKLPPKLPQGFAPITHGAFARAVEVGAAQNPLSVPTLSDDQALGLVWPTYKVHVYYDSGRKVTMSGTERNVLVPMVPFGFYLNHAGTFYGFTHALSGMDGVELVSVAPNWYRVRIKNEGAVRVQTVISAEERMKSASQPCPTCPDPCTNCKVEHRGHCNCRLVQAGSPRGLALAFGGVLAVAVAAAVRRRTRRRSR